MAAADAPGALGFAERVCGEDDRDRDRYRLWILGIGPLCGRLPVAIRRSALGGTASPPRRRKTGRTAVPASSRTAISAGTCRPKSSSITRGPRVRIHLPPLNAVLTSAPRVVTATTQITAIKPTSIPYSTKAAPSSSWRNRLITLPTGEIHSYLRHIPRVDRLAQQAVLLTKLARRTFVSKKFRTPVRQPLLRLHLTLPGEYGGAAPGALGSSFRDIWWYDGRIA
jgi:hypothetical protein